MAGMGPEEARQFYEEDEDPSRVFARFDAAEKGRTEPPSGEPAARRPARRELEGAHKQRTSADVMRDAVITGLRETAALFEYLWRALSRH